MIRYQVSVHDAVAHLFEVTLQVSTEPGSTTEFEFATWIPGSYLIREFSRHIVGAIDCFDGNKKVPITQLSKNTWSVISNSAAIELRYRVYAWDFSVRAAHLDQTHGFFNSSSLLMHVASQPTAPVCLTIVKPTFNWKLATTLTPIKVDKAGFGVYQAADFAELIDHPVEMAAFQELRFNAHGVLHRAVFSGIAHFDKTRLAQDLEKICAAQIQFFEPRSKKAPFDQYLFMTQVSTDGYGGLEHRNSTALICARNDLPSHTMQGSTAGYRQYLGLCSHEYFHAWNVKRIKPTAFAPYDLNRENYTHLLWIFEGFTSYYDDLLMLRAGVISLQEYLDMLGKTITRVLSEPGRLVQSIAQSSFEAWTKYYRQDENSGNSLMSYYTKGSLVALCLDLIIRSQTQGKKSLDDVMRLLWQRAKHNVFLGEDQFTAWVREATGCDLRREIKRWAYQPGELPLQELLAEAGVRWQAQYESVPSLGAKLAQRGGDLVVTFVAVGSAASKAGLSANDVIVAADQLRMSESALKALLSRKKVGDQIALTVFRQDQLFTCQAKLTTPALANIKLSKQGL